MRREVEDRILVVLDGLGHDRLRCRRARSRTGSGPCRSLIGSERRDRAVELLDGVFVALRPLRHARRQAREKVVREIAVCRGKANTAAAAGTGGTAAARRSTTVLVRLPYLGDSAQVFLFGGKARAQLRQARLERDEPMRQRGVLLGRGFDGPGRLPDGSAQRVDVDTRARSFLLLDPLTERDRSATHMADRSLNKGQGLYTHSSCSIVFWCASGRSENLVDLVSPP